MSRKWEQMKNLHLPSCWDEERTFRKCYLAPIPRKTIRADGIKSVAELFCINIQSEAVNVCTRFFILCKYVCALTMTTIISVNLSTSALCSFSQFRVMAHEIKEA